MNLIKIQAARRVAQVEEYYFSTKLKQIAQMNLEGDPVINLGVGSPDGKPHESVIQALSKSSQQDTSHGYQSYIGLPVYRQSISDWYEKYYSVNLDPNTEVLPLIGSKEGIMHIAMAFLNRGDRVLVPNPGYPAYSAVSKLCEAELVYYDLKEENDWLPDFNQLESLAEHKPKIMWLNYPNMPTGKAANLDLFSRLIKFGKKHNILVVNDNPYSFILNNSPLSILQIDGAKDCALELNSLSKAQNMAGWRVGMLAGNSELLKYVLRFKSNMDSGQFKATQEAAVQALKLGQEWYDGLNQEYRERRDLIWELFDMLNCTYDKKQNGMFVWARIPKVRKSAKELSEEILQESRVFITPGFIFGSNGENYLRASLCQPKETIQKAIQRLITHYPPLT